MRKAIIDDRGREIISLIKKLKKRSRYTNFKFPPKFPHIEEDELEYVVTYNNKEGRTCALCIHYDLKKGSYEIWGRDGEVKTKSFNRVRRYIEDLLT